MKRFTLIKVAIMALLLTASKAHATLMIGFTPSTMDISIGDTFTIEILATTESPLDGFIGFDIDFDFDSTLAVLENATIGAGFLQALTAFNDLAGFSSTPMPVTGIDVLIATLSFTASSAGTFTFDLGLSQFSALNFVNFQSTALDVHITEASAPAMIGLLALAGIAIVLRRKI